MPDCPAAVKTAGPQEIPARIGTTRMSGWIRSWLFESCTDLTGHRCRANLWIMTDEEALIRAVLDNPNDESAVLVYADWLDERGEARGRYLRLQIDGTKAVLDRSARRELRAEKKSLLRCIDSSWLERLGFIQRDPSLLDATEVAYGWLRDGRYGSRQKAVRALGNRKAYVGFSAEVVREDFELAVAIQKEIARFKADLRQQGESSAIVGQIMNLQTRLRRRFPQAQDAAFSCAIGVNITTWHRL